MFDYTVTSEKEFEQAIADLKQTLADFKFGVLWEMNVPVKLREKGVDFAGQYQILEVCNPPRAKAVLEFNLLTGYFLPCKVVVYVDRGVTKIGLVKPTTMIGLLGDQRIENEALEVERALIAAVDKAR